MRTRKELANALRILAMDAVEQAKSGHPGAPMGMADMAEALWRGVMRHNPANPNWANRDRFVLSNGHASMLLYALLHLTGYDMSMDDLRNFRQFGSKTPGHPEFRHTPGVETTSGPLGQGLASAVGMALAEKLLAAEFNREGFPLVNHYTYVFVGDGCLMEGLSQEAASLAGAVGLEKLIVFYDSNGISIDGKTKGWFRDDTPARFRACGWHVIPDVDGHDGDILNAAITLARTTDSPTLICCRTIIGYGAPNKSGTAECHGSPLGPDESLATRILLGWENDPFIIPEDIASAWDMRDKGRQAENEWNELFRTYKGQYPDLATAFTARMKSEKSADYTTAVAALLEKGNTVLPKTATRVCGKNVLSALAPHVPGLFGMSADLTPSVGTKHASAVPINGVSNDTINWKGNYLSCGVREFAMATAMNGMALHGGFTPYGGTFLVFSDYERAAIRLAAIMGLRSIFVLTHDSIGVGEDGPTHQPVEHIPSLRLIPGLDVWRPCDSVETALAWDSALTAERPSCLALSRQDLPTYPRTPEQIKNAQLGGYVLAEFGTDKPAPDVILIATGSEVALAMQAAEKLAPTGRRIRVVSMPCTNRFDAQTAEYRESVLPKAVRARVAIEAASADFWGKYVGLDGATIGMHSFGASAPASAVFAHFGFTVENLVKVVEEL